MAVQLSSSYLKRSYQLLAKLCVGEMGAVQAFERSGDIVYKWARKKFKNIFRQIPAEKTTLDDKRDGNEIGVIVDQDRARFILRAVHPDAIPASALKFARITAISFCSSISSSRS